MNLETLTIEFVRDMVARRQVNAVALVEQFYAEIEKKDAEIHAYLHLCRERALAKAEEIERLADKGTELPPLAGVPIAIKDVVMTGELLTTAGSRILEKFVAPYDATAFARLEQSLSHVEPRATGCLWARSCSEDISTKRRSCD